MKYLILILALILSTESALSQERVVKEIIGIGHKSHLHQDEKAVYAEDETKPYTGLYLRYDFDSTLLIKGHYLKGKPEGVWREYYANTNFKSALMEECEYKNGVRIRYTKYRPEGELWEEKICNDKGDNLEWREYSRGKLKEVKIFTNGKLSEIREYEKGELVKTYPVNN
jgi:antitoxin component YwqK of YwqJK toxin-antitoxin module